MVARKDIEQKASSLRAGERDASALLGGRGVREASAHRRSGGRAGSSAMLERGSAATYAERKRARASLTKAQMRRAEREAASAAECAPGGEKAASREAFGKAAGKAAAAAKASAAAYGRYSFAGDRLEAEDSLDDSSLGSDAADRVKKAYGTYDKAVRKSASAAKQAVLRLRERAAGGAGAGASRTAPAQVRPGARKAASAPAAAAQSAQKAAYGAARANAEAARKIASSSAAKAARRAAGSLGRGLGRMAAGAASTCSVALLALLLVVGMAAGLTQCSKSAAAGEGLPGWITAAMVEEAIKCQEEYGHPAGCTIAQMIVESGGGSEPSELASRDHNLFGMKWAASFAGEPEVEGPASWATSEDYGGGLVTITDAFIRFKGDVECIRFRSRVFLQASHYAGNALIKAACEEGSSDKMAEGLKDAGWATSPVYVSALKTVMDAYGLRRFDSMTVEEYRASGSGAGSGQEYAAATAKAKKVADAAKATPSPGVNLCAKWVSQVYAACGIPYPYGDACDMYRAWCTSSDRSKLEVGMAVAVDTHPNGGAEGLVYGHIGIYIGDGLVMHNVGSVETCTLDGWIASFGGLTQVRWGYPPGF